MLSASGAEALEIVRTAPPAAILCDHRMAGMNGVEFQAAVAAIDPALGRRFAFMSGDVLNPELREFATAHDVQLLAKPFDIATVGELVAGRRRCGRRRRLTAAGSAARVGVEAAARLLAEMSGRDEVPSTLGGAEVLLAEALVEDLHDPEADVEADEVGELERAHRVVQADLRAGVDVVGRAEALLVGPHRLREERHEDPVDDEARPVGRDDDLLAQVGGDLPDRGLRRVGRRGAADQLDQRHDRNRAEEVHADERGPALGADRGREPVDRDRRGVRREDRAGRRETVELASRAAS